MNISTSKKQVVSRIAVLFSAFLISTVSLSSFAGGPSWTDNKGGTVSADTTVSIISRPAKNAPVSTKTAPIGNRLAPPKRKVGVIRRPAIKGTTTKHAPTSKSRKPRKSTLGDLSGVSSAKPVAKKQKKNAPVSTKVKSDDKIDVSWTDNKGSSPTIDIKGRYAHPPTRKKMINIFILWQSSLKRSFNS